MLKNVAIGAAAVAGIVGRAIPGLLRELAGIGAVGLIAYGAWLVYPPAGYITAGVLLLAGLFLMAVAKKKLPQ